MTKQILYVELIKGPCTNYNHNNKDVEMVSKWQKEMSSHIVSILCV